jgi:hypothetical protein
MRLDSIEGRSSVNQQKPRQPAAIACLVGCGFGMLLILTGIGWSSFGGARLVYSPEQAKEWEEAHAAWHAASSGHVHAHSPGMSTAGDPDANLAAARERFERADAELQSARFVKNRLGFLLLWTGLAVAGAFGVGYLIVRGDQN